MARSFRVFAVVSFAVEALIGFALVVLIVIGALKRWGWVFWMALAVYGLGTISVVAGLVFRLLASVGVFVPPSPAAANVRVPAEPVALVAVGWLGSAAQVVTFVLILLAAIRIGPWACHREVAEGAPPGQQPPDTAAPSAA